MLFISRSLLFSLFLVPVFSFSVFFSVSAYEQHLRDYPPFVTARRGKSRSNRSKNHAISYYHDDSPNATKKLRSNSVSAGNKNHRTQSLHCSSVHCTSALATTAASSSIADIPHYQLHTSNSAISCVNPSNSTHQSMLSFLNHDDMLRQQQSSMSELTSSALRDHVVKLHRFENARVHTNVYKTEMEEERRMQEQNQSNIDRAATVQQEEKQRSPSSSSSSFNLFASPFRI